MKRSYRLERLIESVLLGSALASILGISLIFIFITIESIELFRVVSPLEFLFTSDWKPTEGSFGALPLIVGSLFVTAGALLLGGPISLATAVFLAEVASPQIYRLVRPSIELLAGIPSVIYGFFGIVVMVPISRSLFGGSGFGLATGIVVLSVMILPTIAMLSEDALSAVPDRFRQGALALGATKWEMISQIVLPAARQGIIAAIILGIGRAIGETMAVLMVLGNAPIIPTGLGDTLSALTSIIALDMAYAEGEHRTALFALGLVLLVVSMTLVGTVRAFTQRQKAKR